MPARLAIFSHCILSNCLFVSLWFNVPVNNFSVMLRRSHLFLGIMHQSFVSTAPSGPGISGAFNFPIFKAPLKALHSGAKLVVKSLLKAPALPGTYNNEEQQMT